MTTPSTVTPLYLPSKDQLGLVAVGFSGGQCKPGVDAAPESLIQAGLLDDLRGPLGYTLHYDDKIHTYDDVLPKEDPPIDGMLRPRTVSAVTEKLASQVYEHAKEGRLTLTLGGDHSVAIGSIAGAAKAIKERTGMAMNVIWVDAHADINTPQTSTSGNIHGMPCAFLTGIADPDPAFSWLRSLYTNGGAIEAKRLVYIGLRDVDVPEKKIIRDHGIKAFSMHDIDRWGIGRCVEMALEYLAGLDRPDIKGDVKGEERVGGGYVYEGLGPVYLSLDVDALDPMWAPSTGTPVRGGLTLREGDFICECVHATGALVGMDLVEVNPIAPGYTPESIGAKETVRAGCSLIRCALGESLL
ncbi:arginase [Kalaharituber pfeilii]|nr:arginase [Kalaharituber pfeilii]